MAARKSARKRPATAPEPKDSHGAERLQKVLAAAGIGSRRECEEYIIEGRVEVDRQVVTKLGTCVDPTVQQIRVDGTDLPRPRREYFVLNKPTGVVCTNSDPSGRARVIDLIRSDERLFPVGRLDRNSEGLILVTNDGELSNKLTHPRYGIEKTYRCRVAGQPTPELLGKLKRGVRLSDGMARMASVIVKRRYKESTELEIVLNEGRNREIRRVLARIGHKVLSLKRIAIGPLRLGDLPLGAHRMLEREEISRLRHALDARQAAAKAKQSPGNETGKSTAGTRKSTTGARKSTTGAEDQRRHQRGKPAAKRRAPATSSGPQEVAAPRTGTILGVDDEAQPTKKQSAPKRVAKKRPTKRAAPKRPAAKRPPRKKAKTTRKKRR